MAKCWIVYWQEIPSLVEARDEEARFKAPLSQAFQELIDLAAMQRKLHGSADYLKQWKKGRPFERPGPAKEAAQAVAAELEADFAKIKAEMLAGPGANGG